MIKQTIEQILSNTRLFDKIFNIFFHGSTYQSRSILRLSGLNRTKNSNTASEKDRKHFKNFELGRPWTGRSAVQAMCRLLVQTGMSWTIFGGQDSDEIICLFSLKYRINLHFKIRIGNNPRKITRQKLFSGEV